MDKLTQKQVALAVITSVFYWPVNFFLYKFLKKLAPCVENNKPGTFGELYL